MVGGSTLGIGITMFLRDQFSGPASRIRSSAAATQEQLMKMQEDQLRSSRNMYAGLAMAGGMAVRGMSKVIGTAAKFGFEMRFVKEISKSSFEEQDKLSRQAMELGQRTIFFAKDVAEGMRFMAMAGMGYKEVTGNIGAAVNLAAAANLSIAGRGGAADIMTNIMKIFTIRAKDSTYVADILAEAATSANLNVFELGEALKYAGNTAVTLKVPLQEAAAMAMTLANAGMQGSMAGVAMENSMRYLVQSIGTFASGTQKQALSMLGLSAEDFRDADGNFKSMVHNIGLIKKAAERMGTVEQYNIAKVLFGVRGARAGLLIMRNYEEFLGHFEKFEKARGRSAEISMGMMDTLEGNILRVKATLSHLGIFFTQSLEPVLRPFLKMLEGIFKALQWLFKIPVLGNFIGVGIAAFITLKTLGFAYRAIVAGIRLVTLQSARAAMVMGGQTAAAYHSMTGAAMRYQAVAGMSRFGIGIPGMQTGAYGFKQSLYGGAGGYYVYGGGRMGTFKSASKAAAFARKSGLATRLGPRAVGGASLGLSRMAAEAGARGVVGGALGRLVGILGGPLGLALSFIIPGAIAAVIRAIKGSKEATERNSKALEEQNRAKLREEIKYTRMGHIIKFQDIEAPSLKVIGTSSINQVQSNLSQERLAMAYEKLVEALRDSSNQNINLYLDGEIIDQRIEKSQVDNLSRIKPF